MTRRRDERGAGTVLAGIVVAVMLVGALVLASTVIAVGGAHRARAGADLTALAGASSLASGGLACPEAERIAVANRGRLVDCEATSTRVDVVVAVPLDWFIPGLPREAFARAAAEVS